MVGFQQSRLLEDGQTVTRLEAKDYFSFASPQPRRLGLVQVQGRVTLFRISDEIWHVLAETQGQCRVDLDQLPGFDTKAKMELFKVGPTLQNEPALPTLLTPDRLSIPPGAGKRLFRLQLADRARVAVTAGCSLSN